MVTGTGQRGFGKQKREAKPDMRRGTKQHRGWRMEDDRRAVDDHWYDLVDFAFSHDIRVFTSEGGTIIVVTGGAL